MAVTRRALLISNPGEIGDEHYCKGVQVDVRNYTSFLCSALGGFWQQTEIQVLERPSTSDAKIGVGALRQHEYSFVAFSGHGWFSTVDRQTILVLREGEYLGLSDLLTGAFKRTVIVDCCREVIHDVGVRELRAKYAEVRKRSPSPELCRAKFLSDVASASTGIIVAHSCGVGETAGDDERWGGRYTSSLLSGAVVWGQTMSQISFPQVGAASVVESHEVAAEATRTRSGGTQNPTIEKPRTEMNYFPFAVFA